jgi:hypothetical protein
METAPAITAIELMEVRKAVNCKKSMTRTKLTRCFSDSPYFESPSSFSFL